MNRRRFVQGSLTLAGLGALAGCAGPLLVRQPPMRTRRIGYLTVGAPPPNRRPRIEIVRDALGDLGWVEGRDVIFEPRYPERADDMSAAADELIRLPVDLLIVAGQQAAQAAKAATDTIPIVMTTVGNAQTTGLVSNLARPEGNITGFTTERTDNEKKALQLLAESVPRGTPVALLFNSTAPGPQSWRANLADFQVAAQTLGVDLMPVGTSGPPDYPRAFTAMTAQGVGAVHILPDEPSSNNLGPLARLALDARLPAHLGLREFPSLGGLMAYGIDFDDVWRRAAIPIDKLLRGAKPGDIPVELPTQFDFIVNLGTAQALGLAMPQAVLRQATEVIR